MHSDSAKAARALGIHRSTPRKWDNLDELEEAVDLLYADVIEATKMTLEDLGLDAARALGESSSDIVLRYILPNIWPPILVLASIRGAIVILVACALSFLGLGVQPPTTEWGAMIAAGKIYLVRAPHLTLFPGLVISLTVFSFNLIGDALRDIMDVKLN